MPTTLISRSPRARYAALLIALPLLAGCSAGVSGAHASGSASPSSQSASSGSASSAELKPCDYLSAADASTIVGETVTSTEADGACSYDGSDIGFATTVTPISGANDPNWKDEVKSFSDVTKLPGVGDEAYGEKSSYEEKVAVRKGNTVIEVANADASDSTTYPNSVALAKAIIAKLG